MTMLLVVPQPDLDVITHRLARGGLGDGSTQLNLAPGESETTSGLLQRERLITSSRVSPAASRAVAVDVNEECRLGS